MAHFGRPDRIARAMASAWAEFLAQSLARSHIEAMRIPEPQIARRRGPQRQNARAMDLDRRFQRINRVVARAHLFSLRRLAAVQRLGGLHKRGFDRTAQLHHRCPNGVRLLHLLTLPLRSSCPGPAESTLFLPARCNSLATAV